MKKGVVLCGGTGSRMGSLTRITNKHLLPVYDRVMVEYPIKTLVDSGISDIMLVTGGNSAGDFLRLLRNGKELGIKKLNYAMQEGNGGIADALLLTEDFADGEPICVILGDNIFEKPITKAIANFKIQEVGARIFLKEVVDPSPFGVPVFKDNDIIEIEEKPRYPKSQCAVTGIYLYDSSVFSIIRTLKPSKRNELEVSDLNNEYIKQGRLQYDIIEGFWQDTGTPDNLLKASNIVKNWKQKQIYFSISKEINV